MPAVTVGQEQGNYAEPGAEPVPVQLTRRPAPAITGCRHLRLWLTAMRIVSLSAAALAAAGAEPRRWVP